MIKRRKKRKNNVQRENKKRSKSIFLKDQKNKNKVFG